MEQKHIELICEAVHKAYCDERLKQHRETYWTGGDYNKLDEATKDYDRETVKAVLKAINYDSLKAKADVCDELVELLKDTWEFLLVPATHHGGQTCIISASQMKIQRDKIEQALAKAERIE